MSERRQPFASAADDAVEIARTQSLRAMEVTANPLAEGFYEKVGFVWSGTAQTQFGTAIRMRLEIANPISRPPIVRRLRRGDGL